MSMKKLVAGLSVSMALFACSPAEMPSRNMTDNPSDVAVAQRGSTPHETPRLGAYETVAVQYNIVGHTIDVPRTLLVSEADVYVPLGDIVWHGDPPGDRYAQVAKLFDAGFVAGHGSYDLGP